ncbi:tyrosine-type recombinase/integrase [Duganella sp. FT80W]|uniref:Tyrosine-type recombinase/integrase n=1 Tax=Duganella guangzhouensis TaxID=2666084 RepID=A0A6I2L2H4_9BURK|nr:tyrosine-type recombinase/integrase [Duganella guangzhouensis]MRW91024.1 tyrosine-type recombinase/integrase [Duganella guangzhouensis]
MTIKKTENGWLVDIQPGGRGHKRIRKTLMTKAEALQFEAWAKTQVAQNEEWIKPKKNLTKLSELIELWQSHHGIQLRHSRTYSTLLRVCEALGNPIAEQLKSEHFAAYRAARLAEGVARNTINREHAYLRAVFNELIRLGFWSADNPLARLRQFKIAERELSYLTGGEIRALLAALEKRTDRDALLITKLCLASAARWNEAESLRIAQLHSGMIHFTQTKTDKNRSIPIDDELAEEVREFHKTSSRDATGRIFKSSVGAFRMAVKESGIELLPGQLTHVLRHTFASHFMMNGGNILALQKVLGHSSLQTTMIYAHLSPDHLQEAKMLNPLTRLTVG